TDYTKVMANMAANAARLKGVTDFTARDLTDSTEVGPTFLGRLIIALQQLITETEPQAVIRQLQEDLADFMELRPVLIGLVEFLAQKSNQIPVRQAAEVLAGRLRNQRVLGQD
ncbi:MAG: DNA methylase, partial [bacterium]|nr:DNA methylase [bacterium]